MNDDLAASPALYWLDAYQKSEANLETAKAALETIMLNCQHDRGDEKKDESWACIVTARKALKSINKKPAPLKIMVQVEIGTESIRNLNDVLYVFAQSVPTGVGSRKLQLGDTRGIQDVNGDTVGTWEIVKSKTK